jgi:phage-related baseplate assembly protein
MSGFIPIDLSKLPAPEVIKTVSFDALLDEMKAEAISQMPDLAPFLDLESEPVSKILRVCAYFRMLDRLEFNDGARANMLALATGTNLDGLAAFWGVERLVVQAADDNVTPPLPQILEADDAFRSRVQQSLEGHSTAGPRGAYRFWALSASGEVKDAAISSGVPGEVLVTILSVNGDGTPSNSVLSAVEAVLNDEDVRPMNDQVTVQAAEILTYTISAHLIVQSGPDASAVQAAASAAIETYVAAQHGLGRDVTLSGIYAALHQPGVANVQLASPAADIPVNADQAAFCSPGPSLTVGAENV